MKGALDDSGFQLMAEGFRRWEGESFWAVLKHHGLGMLMTMGLLTLGAPFWFNTLRSLTNLRSVLASDISQEQEADTSAKKDKAGKAAPPGNAAQPKMITPPGLAG